MPGLAVAVSLDGEWVWSEGFGVSDRARKTPASPGTRFRIGSISKPLTSVALGLLVQEGHLDLDLPVQAYVPSFPKKRAVLTTRLVAGHLSGLAHYRGKEFVNKRHYDSVTAALDKFKDRPLVHEPGERLSYSSYGWNLIGAVLEGASGKPYLELMTTRVLEPLRLNDTVAELPSTEIPNRAQPYARFGPLTLKPPKIDNSDAYPSAGFLSSAEDLVRLGEAMLAPRLLEPETVELLWTELRTNDGKPTGYGLGWQIRELAGRRAVGHGGRHLGATAALWIVPGERLVVAAVANANSEHLGELPGRIVEALLGPME